MGQSCHRPFAPAAPLGRLLALPGQAPDLITSRSHLTCLLSREDFSAAQTESGLRALRPRLSAVSPPSRAHGNSSVITGLPCRPGGHEGRAASPSDRRPRAGRCPWPAGAASKQPGNRDPSPCNNSVRTWTTAALGKQGSGASAPARGLHGEGTRERPGPERPGQRATASTVCAPVPGDGGGPEAPGKWARRPQTSQGRDRCSHASVGRPPTPGLCLAARSDDVQTQGCSGLTPKT